MGVFYAPIRRSMYLSFGLFDKVMGKKAPLITIFSYHSINNGGWNFSVTKQNFKKQINYLSGNIQFISLVDIVKYLKGKKNITKPSAVITFDDGYKDILQIKDYLTKKGIKPTVFVLSDRKKASRHELQNDLEFLSNKDIKKLYASGWEIGCHTATHPDMDKLTEVQIEKEVIDSKYNLEKELAFPIKYIAYPKGKYNDRILDASKKAHYQLGLSMNDDNVFQTENRLKLPRIGVDGTHSFSEFKVLASPSVSIVRKLMKKFLI